MPEPQVEASIVAQLRDMLSRAASDPRGALGVGDRATAQEVRAAFLEITKRFHPTKFARLSPDTIRLANDVFIALRNAHASVAKSVAAAPGGPAAPAGSGPVAARAPSQPMPAQAPTVGRLGTPSAPPAVARVATTPAVARTRTPSAAVPPSVQRTSTPSPAPPLGAARTATGGSGPVTAPRTSTPSPAPPLSRSRTSTGGGPITGPRTATPSPAPPLGARAATGAPVAPAAAVRSPVANVTMRPRGDVGAAATVQGSQPPVFDEQASLRIAMELLGRRRWADAKQAFLALATKVPAEKRYRALLAVARGREHQDENRHAEARVEFKRALDLEPNLEAARAALEQLPDAEKKSGGLFGRLLKK